jgi:hypothetical protein
MSTVVVYPTSRAEIHELSYTSKVSIGFADTGKFACPDRTLNDGRLEPS